MAWELKFSTKLLNCIQRGENDEVRSMLNKDIVMVSDDRGTLLHYASMRDNAEIIKDLIKLGCDIDARRSDGNTALMLAVKWNYAATVKVLLEAGANYEIVGRYNESALQQVFGGYNYSAIIEAFINRLRTETNTTEQLLNKLIELGSTMYHAACSRDIEVMNYMLNRGFNVDSRGPCQMTALYAAALQDDLNLAKWLVIEKGADVNARDQNWFDSPLYIGAIHGNKTMVQFLLEHGANPNIKCDQMRAPLFTTFSSSREGVTADQYNECAECLLLFGAIPCTPNESPDTLFDLAISRRNDKRLKLLTAHLAMLEMLGFSITESVMYCKREENRSKMSDYENYYQSCQQVLTIIMHKKLSLLDLLDNGENKMRPLVRNETFVSKIMEICSEHELKKLYPYYYNILVKRISKAEQIVELEEASIIVISKISENTFNECYDFGRKVVSYLCRYDLEKLCRVYE